MNKLHFIGKFTLFFGKNGFMVSHPKFLLSYTKSTLALRKGYDYHLVFSKKLN